jgi:CubicO group peptidase (beta-lactamase class C family)
MKTCRRSFLQQVGVGVGAGLVFGFPAALEAGQGRGLPRSAPETQGVSSDAILGLLDAMAASNHEYHSLMILRHGHVIAEGWWKPYRPKAPQMLYSLSKSFTSTAVGLAVSEGRLSVDDKVLKFFPDEAPDSISENLAALRVRDLLSMSVGQAQDSTGSLWGKEDWVRQFLSLAIANPPGTAFLYNSGATYMCSAIVQKVTGQRIIDYLTPRLFRPLGIEGMTWETCPRGINTGGWGLKLPTEALARFGQLYLQRGVWNGKQVISPSWVDLATSFKIQQPASDLEKARRDSDWHQGYCYQFWRSRHNSYRGDGAYGQYVVVMPDQDAVVAITSETPNMQGEMNILWEHLLPALKSGGKPGTGQNYGRLKSRLASLQLPPLQVSAKSPLAAKITARAYLVDSNEQGITAFTWDISKRKVSFTLKDSGGSHLIRCGLGDWLDGETTMPGMPPKLTRGELGPVSKVAGCATWTTPRTLEMRWQFYETPHHASLTCEFTESGDTVEVALLDSLAKMGNKQPRCKLKATASAKGD